MGSTFHGLEVGKRSLFAQQSALSTTGHNISNTNTKGYTRQRVELEAAHPMSYPGMNNERAPRQLGTGVNASEITRIREEFLDDQFRGENQSLGYWQQTNDIYSKIEEVFNEPSDDGLQKLLDTFWQGWSDLANNPENSAEGLAARTVVRERGVAVADTFHQMMNSLDQLEADIKNVMGTKVKEMNSIASQIKDLNDQIQRLVPHGYNPNDLYDQRDVLIDQLSSLVNLEVKPGTNGMVDISVGGQPLVSSTTIQTVAYDENSGKLTLGGNDLTLTSGEVLALKDGLGGVVDGQPFGIIPEIRNQLNLHAVTFANELNKIHQTGLNLEDIKANKTYPNTDGILFFVDKDDPTVPPKDAHSLMINPKILESLDRISAAQAGNVGDGKNAQAIAALKYSTMTIGGQTTSLDGFYQYTISQLGIRSQESDRLARNSEVMVNQIENRRQSVSGVSLDEEMSNMIKYQQAYNAAARFVTTIDEVLDKVVNGMGRVGL